MKHTRKLLSLLLSMLLLLALLPAATAAESDLRAAAVGQAEAIATVPWTLGVRIAKANVTGSRREYFNDNGIFPTTYFEYSRLHFPIRGVMVEANTGSLEKFKSMIDESASIVPGYGHINDQMFFGMDVNAFLADVICRVSPKPVNTLRQALTDDSLEALLPGADLSAASSKEAIGSADVKSAYAKLQPGDLLLAWDNNSDVLVEPRIAAMVVKSVDPSKRTAEVIYPSYNLLLWNFKCSRCGATDTEGPTSAALPVHVNSNGYAFDSFKKHSETDPSSRCNGDWEAVYASTWRIDTVTFDQMAGTGDQKVLDASRGYLPYTLKAYQGAPTPVDVKVTTNATPDNVVGGLKAHIASNYRISAFEATLTPKGGTPQKFLSAPDDSTWECDYDDPKLDLALLDCEPGEYHLTVDVLTGPVTDAKTMAVPATHIVDFDFSLTTATAKIALDKDFIAQGDPISVSIIPFEAGMTGVRATVSYDAGWYVFDPAASKAANPKLTYTDNGDGTVTAEYYGAPLAAGSKMGTVVFTGKRTGFEVTKAEDTGPFFLSGLYISKKEGATAADLAGSRPDTTPYRASIGTNTVIYKNYAAGYDLILAFMCTPEMTKSTSDSSIKMVYDGKAMIDVSSAHYKVDDNSFVRIYGYITANADSAKVAVGTETCSILKYNGDVNQSGWVDVNDVQAIDNIIKGKMPLDDNMARWLQADVNRDGKADAADMTALMDQLMK